MRGPCRAAPAAHVVRVLSVVALTALLVLFASAAMAQDAPAPQPKKPEEQPVAAAPVTEESPEAVPVAVVHDGDDPVGIQLAFSLKETFSRSPLFRLAGAEEKKISVRVATRAEFPGRPGLGTVYALTWVYSERPDVLGFFLDAQVGAALRDEVNDAAKAVAARTDEVAARYGYLFE